MCHEAQAIDCEIVGQASRLSLISSLQLVLKPRHYLDCYQWMEPLFEDGDRRDACPTHMTKFPAPGPNHRVWLRVGTLLDGVSTKPFRNANLVYSREQIHFVGEANAPPPAIS